MRWFFPVFCFLAACTNPPSGGGSGDATTSDVNADTLSDALSDTTVTDVLTDADPDSGGCPFIADGTPASLPPFQCCCDGLGSHVSAVCTAGAWKCAVFDAGYKIGTDMCNPCPGDADVPKTDIPDTSDVATTCANQPTCCCSGCTSKPSACVNGSATCSVGYSLGTMSGSMCMCECADVPQPDIHDADDTTAPSSPSALCVATGGSVISGPCCASQSDFPNACGIGGCSCAPSSSKTIQKCDCGGGKCFDPAVGCK